MSMLKKLRIKFISLNMTVVVLVLAVVFTSICVIDYQKDLQNVQGKLDAALAHVGSSSPLDNTLTDGVLQNADPTLKDKTPAQDSASNANSLEIGGRHGGSEPFVPVAVYVASNGSLQAVSGTGVVSIEQTVLDTAASQLADVQDGDGSLDGVGLYYAKRTVDGAAYYAFADMSATSGWRSLALTLAAVGAAALAAFFIISVFFSRWALHPVEKAWEQQRRFVADASHELKTPLTVILANTSIMLEHPERSIASQSQWVESTQAEAQSMQELVGELLLMAKIDEGSAKPEREALDFTDIVEGSLLQFESVAFERDVSLDGDLEPNVIVLGETSRLHRLVATLIDNACKYANSGGSVNVTLKRVGHASVLAVHNTGSFIAAEDLPHVFDRFYRADKARTHDNASYGLGLAIARGLAEDLGGTLEASSADGEGTTFTARFPLAPEDKNTAGNAS